MLELYLIRHAESTGNVNPEYIGGQSNFFHLTERGQRQAIHIGKRLKETGVFFDKMACSTALRAEQTCRAIAKEIDFPEKNILYTPQLLELSQGDWEGKLRTEVYTPEVLAQIYENNWEFKAPNGESQKDVEERIYEWVDTNLIQTSFMGKVGLVTHGMTIKSFFRKIMSSDARMTYKIKIENTSITQFNYTPAKGWTLERLNDFKP